MKGPVRLAGVLARAEGGEVPFLGDRGGDGVVFLLGEGAPVCCVVIARRAFCGVIFGCLLSFVDVCYLLRYPWVCARWSL